MMKMGKEMWDKKTPSRIHTHTHRGMIDHVSVFDKRLVSGYLSMSYTNMGLAEEAIASYRPICEKFGVVTLFSLQITD